MVIIGHAVVFAVSILLTIYRCNMSLRFFARPLIGLQYCIQIRVRNGCVPVHDFFDNLPDVRKTYLVAQKPATATSFAAFMTAGSVPPISPARRARFNAGKSS